MSPFPGLMLERCCLSVTLHVIVLFLAKKYQQTLHISHVQQYFFTYHCCWSCDGMPLVLQSAAHGYAHFIGSLLCDMRKVR